MTDLHRARPRRTVVSRAGGPRRGTRRGWRLAVAAPVLAVALVACGSASDGPTQAELTRQRLERRNRDYLVGIGWKQHAAACVAERIDLDLTVLLDGSHDKDPTSKAGFEAFAKAAQRCIHENESTTTR